MQYVHKCVLNWQQKTVTTHGLALHCTAIGTCCLTPCSLTLSTGLSCP